MITKEIFLKLVKVVVKLRLRIAVLENTIEDAKPDIVEYVKAHGEIVKPDKAKTDDRRLDVDGIKVHWCLQEKRTPDEDRIRVFVLKGVRKKPALKRLFKRKVVLDDTLFEKFIKDKLITEEEIKKFDLYKVKESYRLDIGEEEKGFCSKCANPVLTSDKFCSECGAKDPLAQTHS